MNKKFPVLLAALLACGLSAKASPPVLPTLDGAYASEGDFYVKLGGSAVWFNPPKYQLPTAQDGVAPYGSQPFIFDNDSVTGSGSATFGYVISHKPAADWVGSNLRIELSAGYLGADNSVTEQTSSGPNAGQTGFFDVRSISTGVPLGTIATPGQLLSTSYQAEYEMITADLLAKADYEFAHGKGLFTPEFGLSFAYFDQRFGSFQYNVGTPTNTATLHESIENTYLGPKLGFALQGNITRGLSLFLDAESSLLNLDSSYSGVQNVLGNGAQQNDGRNQFAFRGQLTGGVAYNFNPVIVRLAGTLDYWQNVGAIQRTAPTEGGNFTTASGPTTIGHAIMANEGLNLSVIVPF